MRADGERLAKSIPSAQRDRDSGRAQNAGWTAPLLSGDDSVATPEFPVVRQETPLAPFQRPPPALR